MKFIVIEGLDGSGKSTQIRLLKSHFENHKIKYQYLHFPRTDSPFFGELVARFLRGESGDINSVDPYLVALIYAGDRNDAKEMIRQWQKEDYLILVDRYVISNIAFQCAKFKEQNDRDKLKHWILDLEYNYYRLPKPDLNIFLDVPFEFTRKQLSKSRAGQDREYLKGNRDIHEDNLDFQRNVRDVYLSLEHEIENMKIIDCTGGSQKMLTPEKILEMIIENL